jgi:hypothetical protein
MGGANPMLEMKITTMRVTFSGVKVGEPPIAVFHKILTRPDGKQKYVALSVPVRDAGLLARVAGELHLDDGIEVTVETRWAEKGIPKTLLNFAKVHAPRDKTLLAVG